MVMLQPPKYVLKITMIIVASIPELSGYVPGLSRSSTSSVL